MICQTFTANFPSHSAVLGDATFFFYTTFFITIETLSNEYILRIDGLTVHDDD